VTVGRGGWNQRVGTEVARCACRDRRFYWACLDPRAGAPCCGRLCCLAPRAAIVSTRDEIQALRVRATREAWRCPRCGELVTRHWRNFECLDALTRAVREHRARSTARG
jgi:hypothetical protein